MKKVISMVKLMSMFYLLLGGLYVHAQENETEAKTSKALLCYVDTAERLCQHRVQLLS